MNARLSDKSFREKLDSVLGEKSTTIRYLAWLIVILALLVLLNLGFLYDITINNFHVAAPSGSSATASGDSSR